MLKAKIAALCVCPALVAPPVIVAVHKPARHAVAHLLQRAANRLDGTPAPVAPPIQYANLPCAPTLADAGGGGGGEGVPTIGGLGLSSFAGPASNSFGDASHPGNGITLANGGGGGGGFFRGWRWRRWRRDAAADGLAPGIAAGFRSRDRRGLGSRSRDLGLARDGFHRRRRGAPVQAPPHHLSRRERAWLNHAPHASLRYCAAVGQAWAWGISGRGIARYRPFIGLIAGVDAIGAADSPPAEAI